MLKWRRAKSVWLFLSSSRQRSVCFMFSFKGIVPFGSRRFRKCGRKEIASVWDVESLMGSSRADICSCTSLYASPAFSFNVFACCKNISPELVRVMGWLFRLKSVVPRDSSSSFIRRLKAGCVMLLAFDAALKDLYFTRVKKSSI